MLDKLCFVQFLHSGGEPLSRLDGRGVGVRAGEAPSQAEAVSTRVPDGPNWVHRPVWSHQTSYRGLHNTDPFVFGDRFHYTGCLQHTKRGPTQLRNLSRGSVILFGSKRPGRPEFTLDTVFDVAGYVDHAARRQAHTG